jgi:methyl-accepting chemotaxis protein
LNGETMSKLTLNKDCRDFFCETILEQGTAVLSPAIRSHQLLADAKSRFRTYLHRKRDELGACYGDWLVSLRARVTNQLTVLIHELGAEADAGVVFETTNNRGTDLNELDKVKNYLLDVGLQLRYTATIVVIAIVLTAILGHRIYRATQDTSKVILWTGLVDPSTAQELQSQFAQSDRTVLFGIIGFGIILVLSISGVGILLTHKVAGPLYKTGFYFDRMAEGRLGNVTALRQGDMLQDFFGNFREMHETVRTRLQTDLLTMEAAAAALRTKIGDDHAALDAMDKHITQRKKQLL